MTLNNRKSYTERKWIVEIADLAGITVDSAWRVNECLSEALLHFLLQRKYIIINNFGSFKIRKYHLKMKMRLGKPVTPEQAEKPAFSITFCPCRALKHRAYQFYAERNKRKVNLFKNQPIESA